MKQLENEILQVEREARQIESETERLRKENARLRQKRAKQKAWRTSVEQFFYQPESNLTQQAASELDSKPSSPRWANAILAIRHGPCQGCEHRSNETVNMTLASPDRPGD